MEDMPMVTPSRCRLCEVKDAKIAGLQQAEREAAAFRWLEKTVAVDGLYNLPRFEPVSANPQSRFAWYSADYHDGPFDTLLEAVEDAMRKGAGK